MKIYNILCFPESLHCHHSKYMGLDKALLFTDGTLGVNVNPSSKRHTKNSDEFKNCHLEFVCGGVCVCRVE